jgi:hypothetical protein
MMHLIRHEDAEILVTSLEGYEDCEIIEQDVPDPPCDSHWCTRVNGEWIVDEAAKVAAEEQSRLIAMSPVELKAEAQGELLSMLEAAGVLTKAQFDVMSGAIASRSSG